MNIKSDDKIRLLDIAGAIREVQGYLGGANYEQFTMSEDKREAVSAQLVIIGGAAALLSDEFKEKYGKVDWDLLKGLQYAHYDEILELDQHSMLHIASSDLPGMLSDVLEVAEMLEDEDNLKADSLNEEDYEDLKDRQKTQRDINIPKAEEDFTGEREDTDKKGYDEEDDSYIDKRYTDESPSENSSLEEEREINKNPKSEPGKK